MAALEENIALLEREMKSASAALAKAETQERSGGLSSAGPPADLELMLGTLEDKLLLTTQELEELRRLSYFPAVDGYQLRFSSNNIFVGFKDLLLEELSGALTLSITPGVGQKGLAVRVPTVVLRLGGSAASGEAGSHGSGGGGSGGNGGSGGSGGRGGSGGVTASAGVAAAEGGGGSGCGQGGESDDDESGALLRFRGEGVSLVSRREMLGMALSPNLSLQRIDVSVRFAATIPLVYYPRRRAWRPESGFKIELLPDRAADRKPGGGDAFGGAPEQLLRVLLQSLVEGLMKTVVHRQLGPHLGEYLRHAAEGCGVSMEP